MSKICELCNTETDEKTRPIPINVDIMQNIPVVHWSCYSEYLKNPEAWKKATGKFTED